MTITIRQATQYLAEALRQMPNLTPNGHGLYDQRGRRAKDRAAKKTAAEIEEREKAELANETAEMSQHIGEVVLAAEWLQDIAGGARVNTKHTSYGYKHMVERWQRARASAHDRHYVSNGAFIAAAIGMGFKFKAETDNLNVQFNIPEAAVKKREREASPELKPARRPRYA